MQTCCNAECYSYYTCQIGLFGMICLCLQYLQTKGPSLCRLAGNGVKNSVLQAGSRVSREDMERKLPHLSHLQQAYLTDTDLCDVVLYASDDMYNIAYPAHSLVLGLWSERFAADIQAAKDDGCDGWPWRGQYPLKLHVPETDTDELCLSDLLCLIYSNASRETIRQVICDRIDEYSRDDCEDKVDISAVQDLIIAMINLRMPKLVHHIDCYLGTVGSSMAGRLLDNVWQAQDWMDLCGRAHMPLWQARCERYIIANADQEDLAEMASTNPKSAMRVLNRLMKQASSTDKRKCTAAITAAEVLSAALARRNAGVMT